MNPTNLLRLPNGDYVRVDRIVAIRRMVPYSDGTVWRVYVDVEMEKSGGLLGMGGRTISISMGFETKEDMDMAAEVIANDLMAAVAREDH